MIDKNKLLDEVMRREKMRVVKRFFKVGAFILLFGAIYTFSEYKNFDRVKFSTEMTGVVESIQTSTNKRGEKEIWYTVKLSSDKIVKILQPIGITTLQSGSTLKQMPEQTPEQMPKKVPQQRSVKQGESVNVLREELESGHLQFSIISKGLD